MILIGQPCTICPKECTISVTSLKMRKMSIHRRTSLTRDSSNGCIRPPNRCRQTRLIVHTSRAPPSLACKQRATLLMPPPTRFQTSTNGTDLARITCGGLPCQVAPAVNRYRQSELSAHVKARLCSISWHPRRSSRSMVVSAPTTATNRQSSPRCTTKKACPTSSRTCSGRL